MNRIFLAEEELHFKPDVLVCINDLVVEQSVDEFNALKMPKFFSWRARKWLQMDDYTHFLYTTYTEPKFARDLRGRVWEGATVTNVCLQLAYHLGFKEAILIGVDHSFATKGTPNTTVQSQGDDPPTTSQLPISARASAGNCPTWRLPKSPTAWRAKPTKRTAAKCSTQLSVASWTFLRRLITKGCFSHTISNPNCMNLKAVGFYTNRFFCFNSKSRLMLQ